MCPQPGESHRSPGDSSPLVQSASLAHELHDVLTDPWSLNGEHISTA